MANEEPEYWKEKYGIYHIHQNPGAAWM